MRIQMCIRDSVEALLIAVSVGYGVMMVWDVTLLYQYFPSGNVSAFFFLRWVDQFLPLAFTGLFINIGLFAHLVIMWMGPLQVKVQGLFVGAPYPVSYTHLDVYKRQQLHQKKRSIILTGPLE